LAFSWSVPWKERERSALDRASDAITRFAGGLAGQVEGRAVDPAGAEPYPLVILTDLTGHEDEEGGEG
jgi:hypothetical protein